MPGLFVCPDEELVTVVHALVTGPFDTPYEGGENSPYVPFVRLVHLQRFIRSTTGVLWFFCVGFFLWGVGADL